MLNIGQAVFVLNDRISTLNCNHYKTHLFRGKQKDRILHEVYFIFSHCFYVAMLWCLLLNKKIAKHIHFCEINFSGKLFCRKLATQFLVEAKLVWYSFEKCIHLKSTTLLLGRFTIKPIHKTT